MVTKSVWTTLLLLLLTATVRAHVHFIRLAVMALAGVAGLYMLHLLAQDYTKITNRPNRPAAPKALLAAGKALGLFKRSVASDFDYVFDTSENEIEVYDRILENDPMGCARKLVCTLATRPRAKLQREETVILEMLSKTPAIGMDERIDPSPWLDPSTLVAQYHLIMGQRC